MSKKQRFLRSKFPPFDWKRCDRCDELIAQNGEGVMYWNPNPRAVHRDICSVCFVAWEKKRREGIEYMKHMSGASHEATP